jgi:hypothetical protein
MINRRIGLWTIGVALLLLGLSARPALAGRTECKCSLMNVYQQDAYRKGRSLSIRLFSVTAIPNYKAEPTEDLRVLLAEQLRKSLQESKYFSSVVILPEDKEPQTDFVLEGDFSRIDEGSRAGRILIGGKRNAAKLDTRGRLFARDSLQPVADFECHALSYGSFLGWGGAKSSTHDTAQKMADTMKKMFPWADKKVIELGKQANKKTKTLAIIAENKQRDNDWRDKPPEKWERDDCTKVISNFISQGDRDERRVEALWFSAPSYQAHLRLLTMQSKEGDIEKSKRLKGGFLPAHSQLKELEKEDAHVVAIAFAKKTQDKGPILWNNEAILATTSLRHVGRPEVRIQPLRAIDVSSLSHVFDEKWAAHYVLLVVPTKLADGKPVIESLNDKLELHTEFEHTPVIIQFDLAHFGLSRVEDLRLKPAEAEKVSSRAGQTPK